MALFLEDYLDIVESLPVELGRHFTQLKELDAHSAGSMDQLCIQIDAFFDQVRDMTPEQRTQHLKSMTTLLKETSAANEQKVNLAAQAYDLVDRHIRRLDDDLLRFEEEQLTGPKLFGPEDIAKLGVRELPRVGDKRPFEWSPKVIRRGGRSRTENPDIQSPIPTTTRNNSSIGNPTVVEASTPTVREPSPSPTTTSTSTRAVRSTRQKKQEIVESPKEGRPELLDMPVDPNEPTYCICQQVSYGEMIACDNDDCDIEWFHYACVGLNSPPQGKWYCPTCLKATTS